MKTYIPELVLDTKKKTKLYLAEIEGHYNIRYFSSKSMRDAVKNAREAYRKFYGYNFIYDDDSIRRSTVEADTAYADEEKMER